MARAGIRLNLATTDLVELQKSLREIFTAERKAGIVETAMKKAIEPLVQRLKQTTPEGPTGNLRASISSKVVAYRFSGNAVGIVGFLRAGNKASESARGGRVQRSRGRKGDRGFHQYWLEEGTQERKISKQSQPKPYTRSLHNRGPTVRRSFEMRRGGKVFPVRSHFVSQHVVKAHEVANFSGQAYYYASSYNSLGQDFTIQKQVGNPRSFTTTPLYPNAFFKKSKSEITLRPMPAGGTVGRPPLKTAFDDTKNVVGEILSRELQISLGRALDVLTRSSLGTLESLGP
jgi:hypothetical protein